MTPLFKKLNLGDSHTVLVLNSPESFEAELSQLAGVKVLRKATAKLTTSFVIGFAVTQSECDSVSSAAARATEGDAIVWIAYPKSSSKNYNANSIATQGGRFSATQASSQFAKLLLMRTGRRYASEELTTSNR